MCWNSEVSLNTFIFSTFGALFALKNHYDWKIVCFTYLFSSMQFVEYMLWNNLNNVKVNEFWSKVGFAIIMLEPYFAINIINETSLRNIFFGLYTLKIVTDIPDIINNTIFKTTVGKNKHLSWNWMSSNRSFYIPWLFFFSVPFYISKHYVSFLFILISFIITYYLYNKAKTFGTMWCWIANFAWIVIIIESFGLTKCLYC
jgi:hypothetical protein